MKKLFFIILHIVLYSCEKDPIDEGIVTNIQGIAFDNWNSTPIKNLKLKVAEYKSRISGIYSYNEFIKWIDSTYTDENGHYNLNFKTSGQGDNYRLHVEERLNIWTYFYNPMEIDSIGMNNSQNLDFINLYPIKLIIDLNDLEFLHLEINTSAFANIDFQNIDVNSGTIARLLYANKHTDTDIIFQRKKTNNEFETYKLVIPASNTSDLTTINLTLSNSNFN